MVINEFTSLAAEITKIGPSSIFILADTNTLRYCVPIFIAQMEILKEAQILEIEPGEESKSIEIAAGLWESLVEQNADRNSLLINVGGGVVCDIGGFIASTFMRGISFINVPTSLLAMVDAGVGGKTGINLNHYKNLIGVFQEAKLSFYYPEFLATLPSHEIRSGFGEVVKHYLLDEEASFHKLLKLNPFEIKDWNALIEENIQIKDNFVKGDLKERGKRAALNLGHTVAHALEALFLQKNNPILHGDAVAAGIVIESHLSTFCTQQLLPEIYFKQIEKYIKGIFPPVLFQKSDIDELVSLMRHDKKNSHSNLTFTLLKKPSEVVLSYEDKNEAVINSLNYYLENA